MERTEQQLFVSETKVRPSFCLALRGQYHAGCVVPDFPSFVPRPFVGGETAWKLRSLLPLLQS